MAQEVGSLRSLNPTSCLPQTLPSKCFVWCYGPEFVAKDLRKWLADTGAKTLYIEPGSPWENGYRESFNSKLRDEFLNGEIFYSLKEVQVLAERWRVHYNTIRPHSSLGYRSPAQKPGRLKPISRGVKSRESLRASQLFTPRPAAIQVHQKLRYTNNPTGTQDRSGQ
ncbi:hypothetical protein HDF12_003966 [Edaphobacter lichenicola]|uniref:Integrase catalytic domain-containing protein n=1 Tax=Tunturiibacter lichenicola TaxID=2051959 RepID=A0A7Y9NQQ6_9BACT|nr:hypothetical protein [Edaphobacter lichenicola]